MVEFYELKASERKTAAHLFKCNKYDIVLINSVLDGHTGKMLVDSVNDPRFSRLDTGAFTIFGGSADHKGVIDLIKYSPIFVVTPENKSWAELLISVFNHKITKLPFTEYHSETIEIEQLSEIIKGLPSEYELRRLDRDLCEQLSKDILNDYFFENYNSTDDFLDRGIGFCILFNQKIVSAATSMASSRNAIDVEIETRDNYRNKGLGTVVGAKLLLHCIQNDMVPKWLAANNDSERLAEKLGLSKGTFYETFLIDD